MCKFKGDSVLKKVVCVYVMYSPDLDITYKSIASLIESIDELIIIDNSKVSNELEILDEFYEFKNKIKYSHHSENIGIASGQNIGIKLASKCDFILLSDQDTIYPEGYVEDMHSFSMTYDSDVSFPTFRTANYENSAFYYKKGRCFFKKQSLNNIEKTCVPCPQGIASGTLIKTSIFSADLFMNEDLFIDWVDFEWCWRLLDKGFSLNQNTKLFIEHKLGEHSFKLFGKVLHYHSPLRHYYIVRNGLYLSRCSNLTKMYKLNLLCNSLFKVVLYPVIFSPRSINLKCMLKATFDGLFKKLGKYS